MNKNNNNSSLKKFFIKLLAITQAIIIVINITYNLIFADKLEMLTMLLSLNKEENIEKMKDKVRLEINKGLNKDQMISDDDKKLLLRLYNKIQKEFKNLETE